MKVMVEKKPLRSHGCVECLFASVSKRRMSEIVDERERFREIHIQAERAGDGAGDLRDLNRVREPVAEVVGIAASKNLSLVFETAKGSRVNHAIPVALKIVAVGVLRFRKAASAGLFHMHRVAGQHGESLAPGGYSCADSCRGFLPPLLIVS